MGRELPKAEFPEEPSNFPRINLWKRRRIKTFVREVLTAPHFHFYSCCLLQRKTRNLSVVTLVDYSEKGWSAETKWVFMKREQINRSESTCRYFVVMFFCSYSEVVIMGKTVEKCCNQWLATRLSTLDYNGWCMCCTLSAYATKLTLDNTLKSSR